MDPAFSGRSESFTLLESENDTTSMDDSTAADDSAVTETGSPPFDAPKTQNPTLELNFRLKGSAQMSPSTPNRLENIRLRFQSWHQWRRRGSSQAPDLGIVGRCLPLASEKSIIIILTLKGL